MLIIAEGRGLTKQFSVVILARMHKTVQELAQLIQGKVVGDGQITIQGITNIETPKAGCITFAQDAKGLQRLENTEISCIITLPSITTSNKPLIHVQNPKLAWAQLLREFFPAPKYSQTISKQADIASTAKIGKNVTVEAFAKISDGAEISEGAVICSSAFVGENVKVGANSILHPHVIIYQGCVVGSSVILHANVVIGADGFGYVSTQAGHAKVPQVGNVIIEDHVEIGACSTVDRAAIGSTLIGKGCKIDNLVQIGHNVILGQHTIISAQTGISGSCKIGSFVTMGGKVGLGDHVEIGDFVMIGAGAGIPSGKKIPAKQIVFGEPARPYQEMRKQYAAQLRSAETLEDVRKLKEKVAALEKQISAPK